MDDDPERIDLVDDFHGYTPGHVRIKGELAKRRRRKDELIVVEYGKPLGFSRGTAQLLVRAGFYRHFADVPLA